MDSKPRRARRGREASRARISHHRARMQLASCAAALELQVAAGDAFDRVVYLWMLDLLTFTIL